MKVPYETVAHCGPRTLLPGSRRSSCWVSMGIWCAILERSGVWGLQHDEVRGRRPPTQRGDVRWEEAGSRRITARDQQQGRPLPRLNTGAAPVAKNRWRNVQSDAARNPMLQIKTGRSRYFFIDGGRTRPACAAAA
ncbi:unnamed protein product [Phytophthora lilii]|uniref:Unnamed protein product n=1 Tax=Phytophthora lilii TaxID=2077276 RepID=A0A9W6U6I8_9STRA|nr:unnamed protein product [Phytophthora lilii]